MKKVFRLLCGAAAMFIACASSPSFAQIVKNGSFEDPTVAPLSFATLSGGLTNWTIGGNIDLIGNYWAAQDGNQSVDLNGLVVGSLTQAVDLVGGQMYNLSFWASGNPDGPPDPKTLDVSIGSLFGTTVSVDKPDSRSAMSWGLYSYNFMVSTTGSYDLLFQSTSIGGAGVGGCGGEGSCYGPALDNVSISIAVPEPEIYAMLGLGLGLIGWAGRRRKPDPA